MEGIACQKLVSGRIAALRRFRIGLSNVNHVLELAQNHFSRIHWKANIN